MGSFGNSVFIFLCLLAHLCDFAIISDKWSFCTRCGRRGAGMAVHAAPARDEEEEQAIAAQLAKLAEVPAISSAWISTPDSQASAILTVRLSQLNLAANTARKATVACQLPDTRSTGTPALSPPVETGQYTLTSHSATGALLDLVNAHCPSALAPGHAHEACVQVATA